MNEETRDRFRLEAVRQVWLGTKQTADDYLGLRLFVQASKDKNVKIRRTVFRRLLSMNFKLTNFKEEDRMQIILNGLKDPDTQVVIQCKQYLIQQICAKEGT